MTTSTVLRRQFPPVDPSRGINEAQGNAKAATRGFTGPNESGGWTLSSFIAQFYFSRAKVACPDSQACDRFAFAPEQARSFEIPASAATGLVL